MGPERLGPAGPGLLPFTLDGTPYALLVPADGLQVMRWAADGRWLALVPGALDEPSKERFYARLGDARSPVGLRVCWRLAHGLSPSVYGVEWWVAQRLAATADERWTDFAAWSVGVGFDPEAAAAHRLCAAVLAWVRSSAQDEKDARRLEQQVFAPPRYQAGRSSATGRRRVMPGFSPAEQADAFQKAFAELGSSG